MRVIKQIAVHCTAGSQQQKAADVVYFHTGPKSKGCYGWSAPGYHYIIEADGTIVRMLGRWLRFVKTKAVSIYRQPYRRTKSGVSKTVNGIETPLPYRKNNGS